MEVEGLRREKDEMYAALTQKHQESLNYYAEIERLNGVLEKSKSKTASSNGAENHHKTAVVVNEKVVNDNSNEIIVLKARIKDLEKRLNIREKVPNSPTRRRFYSECIDDSKDGADISVPMVEHGNDAAAADLRRQLGECEQSLEEKKLMVREREEESLDLHKRLQETEEEVVRSGEEARMLKRKMESLVIILYSLKTFLTKHAHQFYFSGASPSGFPAQNRRDEVRFGKPLRREQEARGREPGSV